MKKMIGKITSDKMQKTRVVEILEMRRHPIYHKAYPVTTKIKAHDEEDSFKEGDIVEIVAIRPKSRDKAWKITRKI